LDSPIFQTNRRFPFPTSSQTAVFEIQPQNKYKAQKELKRTLVKLQGRSVRRGKVASAQFNPPSPHPKEIELTYEQALAMGNAHELHHLHRLAQAEIEDNHSEIKRRTGTEVLYGQVVREKEM
jgi:hypothetical protein